ncbi:MAG: hypothetical protein ACUVUQ_11510 [Thermodesulfovibrionales bacterium]
MIVYTDEPKNKLKETKLYHHIKWAEYEKIHQRPSVKGNKPWYSLKDRFPYLIACQRLVNDRHIFFFNPDRFVIDDSFSELEPYNKILSKFACLYLNSSFCLLLIELFGTFGLGQGALFISTNTLQRLPCLDFHQIPKEQLNKALLVFEDFSSRKIGTIFTELGINPARPIREQEPNPLPDRKTLDDILFDILGLTEDERNEVYWSVCELVKNRLEKARSV